MTIYKANSPVSTLFKAFSLLCILFLTACSTLRVEEPITTNIPAQQRFQQLNNVSSWKLSGKIAFFQGEERERVNLYWSMDESVPSQQLNLSTYLGISVLQLNSEKNHHTLKIDGKKYHGENLDLLIEELTGLTLPTKALSYWLKGTPYDTEHDFITYDSRTALPKTLTSSLANAYGQQQQWHINYSRYKMVNNIALATKFTIKTQNLTIKIAIDKWQVNP